MVLAYSEKGTDEDGLKVQFRASDDYWYAVFESGAKKGTSLLEGSEGVFKTDGTIVLSPGEHGAMLVIVEGVEEALKSRNSRCLCD